VTARLGAALVLAGLLGVGAVAAGAAAGAQDRPEGERAGSVVVSEPDGTALAEGGSATPFVLRLPDGAACPGDSVDEDYRIQSFIVPDGVDPGGLTYESTKPAGEGRWALYAVNSNPFVQGLTAMAAQPGGPGLIEDLPVFDFVVFPPGTLAEGPNRIGIACTQFNETVRYWDTELVLTDAPQDESAELTWVATATPAEDGGSNAWAGWLAAVLVAAVLLGGGVLVLRRRRAP